MIYLLLGSSKEKKHLILHFFCFTLIQNTKVSNRLLVVFNGNDNKDKNDNSAVIYSARNIQKEVTLRGNRE